MPVTRSMTRLYYPVVTEQCPRIDQKATSSPWEIYEDNFTTSIRDWFRKAGLAEGKTGKMLAVTEIYVLLNKHLPTILTCNPDRWIKFGATAYNKTTEFEIQRLTNFYLDIDVEIVKKHYKTYTQVRKFLTHYLKNIRKTQPSLLDMSDEDIANAFKNIEEVEQEKHFKKKSKHVTVQKQTSLLPLLLFTRHDDDKVMRKNMPNVTVRPKRSIPRVNYSGMDMTEEDEGSVYVCETKWKDRVPTHRWVEYPASQANELGDEEWCEEY
jgi:hypothetical protein